MLKLTLFYAFTVMVVYGPSVMSINCLNSLIRTKKNNFSNNFQLGQLFHYQFAFNHSWSRIYMACFINLLHVYKSCLLKLTFNVRGPSYLGLTRPISWLLMPWLLTSPGHQQPWYWLCRIGRFLFYLRKDFNYLRRINVEKWHKM